MYYEEINTHPLSAEELDIGLYYADKKYEERVDADLLRIVFDTIQSRREPKIRLHEIVRLVTSELVLESSHKRAAYRGAIAKINNHRLQEKRKKPYPSPVVKQTEHPFDLKTTDQRTFIAALGETAR
jgi:hypothetical protein